MNILKEAQELFMHRLKFEDSFEEVRVNVYGDRTLRIDLDMEDFLIERLKDEGFKGTIICEERGEVKLGDEKLYAIIDPLDGSFNARQRIPYSATAIAICKDFRLSDVVQAGVINLFTGDIFYADNQLLKLPYILREYDSRIVEIHLSHKLTRPNLAQKLIKLLSEFKVYRWMGAIALSPCMVACNSISAFISITGCRLLDIVPGLFIAYRAGKSILVEGNSRAENIKLDIKKRVRCIVASNEKILKLILQAIH